jgi:polysaccharide pyruvyl transferase WcaK-like protein
LAQSDIVIVNGEGSLHHDRKSALALAQSSAFCREQNIPCCLINSVYQENGPEVAHFVGLFDLVFVRESRSQAELSGAGIDSEVVPDMTLSYPDLPRLTGSGILVTDSSSDLAAVQLHKFYAGTNGAELATLFKPISTPQALRMFVARVIGKRSPKLWRFEQSRFAKSRNPLFEAAPLERVDDLLRRISSTSLIVTGRFHMVCLALLARTPFIALEGNTHKIEGLLADANLSNRFCSTLPDGLDLLAWSKWHDEELETLESFLQKARSRISRMFSRIRELATDQ